VGPFFAPGLGAKHNTIFFSEAQSPYKVEGKVKGMDVSLNHPPATSDFRGSALAGAARGEFAVRSAADFVDGGGGPECGVSFAAPRRGNDSEMAEKTSLRVQRGPARPKSKVRLTIVPGSADGGAGGGIRALHKMLPLFWSFFPFARNALKGRG